MTGETPRWPAVLVLAAVLVTGCGRTGQIVDAGAAPTLQAATSPAPAPPSSPAPSEEPPAPSEDATRPEGDDPDEDAGNDRGGDAGDDERGTAPGPTTTVSVYFTRGERVEAVPRVVPRVARIGSAAIEQLLAGPTANEAAAGYATQIPDGTRLRDLAITDGIAVVDLSAEFESGGGTLALTLRLAQVACTLDAFPTVDGVRFAVEGQVVDVFSGDGLVTDEPVSCSDYTGTDADGGTLPPVPEPS